MAVRANQMAWSPNSDCCLSYVHAVCSAKVHVLERVTLYVEIDQERHTRLVPKQVGVCAFYKYVLHSFTRATQVALG